MGRLSPGSIARRWGTGPAGGPVLPMGSFCIVELHCVLKTVLGKRSYILDDKKKFHQEYVIIEGLVDTSQFPVICWWKVKSKLA